MWHPRQAFLRLFFRLLYNEMAWSYDLVAWLVSLGQWKTWGRTTLCHLQGKRVLELGHGPGHLLVALAERGFAPVGLDLSSNMTRQAKRRLHRANRDVPLVQARAQALPFQSGGLDTVLATFPTEFIVDPSTLHEVTRVLASEGRLVIVVGVQFEGEGLLSSFLTWLYRVTGQDQPLARMCMPRLEQVGLSSRVVHEVMNETAVTLIVAEKD